jgi:UDP-N-acetyl-D-mannosaminuronate dehydrogenase
MHYRCGWSSSSSSSRHRHRLVGVASSESSELSWCSANGCSWRHGDDVSDETVAEMLASGFVATTDANCLAMTDAAVICVPTPLKDDQTPDLSAVSGAAGDIASRLRSGMLVVPESTTYPGTTDGLLRDILETSGLAAGTDFALAFSPQRIDAGNPTYQLRNTPKPFGLTAFYPGPGGGGHCIPIDPNYLSHSVRSLGYQFKFVELAQDVSNRMPAYVVTRVQGQLNEMEKPVKNSKVLVLGLTYKPDIADDRETPARPVIRGLLSRGARVQAHDPHLDRFDVDGVDIDLAQDLEQAIRDADIVVLLQADSSYDLGRIAELAAAVFDTRGIMEGANVERL